MAERLVPGTAFFRPDLSLVGYAFLGAYVFTLFHVIRGYQRRDLHPKSYNTVVVRILGAYVMALVVSVVWDGPGAEVMMFFVGFMPQSALVWLREKLSQRHGLWGAVPLEELAPLTELEGIDLYDRTRLAEEGVNNIEALAHADIVDLMSSTRIAAAELVDWADQAILYLRVGGDAAPAQERRQKRSRRRAQRRDRDDAAHPGSNRRTHAEPVHLRRYGIRTATDLLQAYDQAIRRGGGDHVKEQAEVEALRTALELPSKPETLRSARSRRSSTPSRTRSGSRRSATGATPSSVRPTRGTGTSTASGCRRCGHRSPSGSSGPSASSTHTRWP